MDFINIFSAIFQPILLVLLSVVAILLVVAISFAIIAFIITCINELKEKYANNDDVNAE